MKVHCFQSGFFGGIFGLKILFDFKDLIFGSELYKLDKVGAQLARCVGSRDRMNLDLARVQRPSKRHRLPAGNLTEG